MTNTPRRSTGLRPTAVVHSRVSNAKQAKDGFSLKDQERMVFDHCDRMGWDVVEHFVEPGRSAYKGPRYDFDDALNYMSCTDTDYLVSSYIDRLFRNVHFCCHVDEQSTAEGWYLSVVQMGGTVIDTRDPMGWYMLIQLAAQAEFDSRLKTVRVTAGLQLKMENPNYTHNPQKMDPFTERRMKNLFSRGHKIQEIANQFNEEGLPTPGGASEWTYNGIWAPLKRWGYIS